MTRTSGADRVAPPQADEPHHGHTRIVSELGRRRRILELLEDPLERFAFLLEAGAELITESVGGTP